MCKDSICANSQAYNGNGDHADEINEEREEANREHLEECSDDELLDKFNDIENLEFSYVFRRIVIEYIIKDNPYGEY